MKKVDMPRYFSAFCAIWGGVEEYTLQVEGRVLVIFADLYGKDAIRRPRLSNKGAVAAPDRDLYASAILSR